MTRRLPVLAPCRRLAGALLVAALLVPAVAPSPAAHAQQDRPDRGQTRNVPPEQVVSFVPSTPFNEFIQFINPIFERVAGKTVVDPEGRTTPIGVSIQGAQFFDAFEAVLADQGLTYRETERFFVIEQAREEGPTPTVRGEGSVAEGEQAQQQPATIDTREIEINAILFDLNKTKARQIGLNWSALFGPLQGSGGGSGGGGVGGGGGGVGGGGGGGAGGGQGGASEPFFAETESIFEPLEDILSAPDQIRLATLIRFFNFLEQEGVGKTVANPKVTVQSGQEGQIQIGQDVPVQTQDFAGNTVTQFFSTGLIVNVVPTLLREPVADTTGAPLLEFVHLDVQVENSSSSPSAAGPVIDKNQANTQVVLLDGEQTVIGGLESSDETTNRSGVPLLKDLPPWFFGLRYIFGSTERNVVQRELLIVLQADVVEPLRRRAQEGFDEALVEQQRRAARRRVERVQEDVYQDSELIRPEEDVDTERDE
ncbi:MAG: general secretion pathway protein GspD [Bacteroidetes bacterium QS_9_68_14]|nr:MAG: general secretion pathway protein GspD [Bacteroidetes bacterium QS_9_68_14]